MSTVEMLRTVLQEQGYRPGPAEDSAITFRYYGQTCSLRLQPSGTQLIAELECPLPRPAPSMQSAQQFSRQHPLARLGEQHGQTVLWLSSLLSELDVAPQTATMLDLLDTYSAAVMFGERPVEPQVPAPELRAPPVAPLPVHSQEPEVVAELLAPALPALASPIPAPSSPVTVVPVEPAPPPVAADEQAPAGWEDFWELMNERYHPLARALARLGAPVPSDVQVDMLQGRQVKGTAIMLWESTPQSVVICEPGQVVPEGYIGGTWLRHYTVDQVAASIQHNLRRVGLL
jgi:hypothetical protein